MQPWSQNYEYSEYHPQFGYLSYVDDMYSEQTGSDVHVYYSEYHDDYLMWDEESWSYLAYNQCSNCKRFGHWKVDCPELASPGKGTSKPKGSNPSGKFGGKPFGKPFGKAFFGGSARRRDSAMCCRVMLSSARPVCRIL